MIKNESVTGFTDSYHEKQDQIPLRGSDSICQLFLKFKKASYYDYQEGRNKITNAMLCIQKIKVSSPIGKKLVSYRAKKLSGKKAWANKLKKSG